MAKLQDLLNISATNLNKMTRSELSKVVSQLGSAANKRLKRFEESGIKSGAYSQTIKAGRFSARGKSLNQLRNEYIREKQFLESKTSTIRGYREVKRNFEKNIIGTNNTLTDKQYERFWRFYNKAKSVGKGFRYIDKMKIAYQIFNENKRASFDSMLGQLEERINKEYEYREETEKQFSASDFMQTDSDIQL